MLKSKWMPRPLKTLYILRLLARLTGAFKITFSAAYYQISLEEYQIVCVRSSSFAKGQQTFESINQSIYSQDHPKRTSADVELRNYPKP